MFTLPLSTSYKNHFLMEIYLIIKQFNYFSIKEEVYLNTITKTINIINTIKEIFYSDMHKDSM